jgi:endonuclease/exonuclease/phosphatase (EEP) superfamily protein YafD
VSSQRRGLLVLGFAGSVPMFASGVAEAWPLELISHFMVHTALGATLISVVCALRKRFREALLGAFIALAYTVQSVWPLYVSRAEAPGSALLRVLSANLLYSSTDERPVSAWIAAKQPDVLILQELTPLLRDALAPVLAGYADRLEILRDDAFGIGVYSRRAKLTRIDASQVGELMIAARFDHEGRAVTLLAAHTFPPITPERIRDRQLAALGEFVRPIEANVIAAGDLNITSWSPVFRKLVRRSGLVDSRRGFGIQGSWPAAFPAPLRIPIDHILTSRDVVATGREVGPDIGSDHLPIFAKLSLR